MKLTNQQIAVIEKTLVLNKLSYDDVKLEVLDHIASEIEDLMTIDNYDFEEAFKLVFETWKPELTPSYSWLMGIGFSAPKVVMDKMVSYSSKTMKWLLGLLVTFF